MRAPPDTLTLGETLFEQACAATGIRYRRFRVAKVAGHKRPDYKVNIPDCGAIVEVKELVPNAQERRAAAELAAGRMVGGTQTPGARLRRPIRSANEQLQQASLRGIPAAVAIFDTMFSLSYTDPYNVKVAMYGLDAIIMALPDAGAPYRIGMKSAGKEVLTEKHNTSISAVVIIRGFPPSFDRVPLLFVYHNHFARVPLDPARLRSHVCEQFALGRADDGATGWVAI
ncbi:MAG: hypothetical protein WB760_14945 [Xanthobacteraceae bacterium]